MSNIYPVLFHHKTYTPSYETARKIKEKQDNYCEAALKGHWSSLGEFPEDLQWEALVDVLRGRVKVSDLPRAHLPKVLAAFKIHTHCYEAVDLDGLVRVSTLLIYLVASAI